MEAIFNLSVQKFTERMVDIKDEVEEAYEEDFLEENKVLTITLMTSVFQYVKKYARKYQNTLEMLRLLALIKDSGEVRFLFDSQLEKTPVPWSPVSLFVEAGSEKVKICIINAAKWLEYYYRVYERAGKSLQDNRMVTREFVHILNTPLESKNEKKTEVGNVTSGCDEMFPIRLYNFLNDYIVGQDELKKRLSMVVYRYLKYGERNPLMMIGPSGSGKNYTMEILSRYEELHKELVIYTFDGSNLTPSGFKGVNMEDIFSGFKSKCMAQRKPLTKGIIFLDEADKVINPNTDCNGENVSALVQHQLLSVIAGTSTVSGIDTKNILFILGGAFGRLYELQEARKKNNAVGFVTANKGFDFMAQSDVTLREDLITIGAEKEFLGRISHIVELDKLSREELKAVLFHDKEGVIKRKKEMFAREGLELEFEDNTIDLIVDRVYNENLGARSAVNIVEAVLGAYDFDMLRNGYEKMTVHTGMLNKHEAPLFERSVTK